MVLVGKFEIGFEVEGEKLLSSLLGFKLLDVELDNDLVLRRSELLGLQLGLFKEGRELPGEVEVGIVKVGCGAGRSVDASVWTSRI